MQIKTIELTGGEIKVELERPYIFVEINNANNQNEVLASINPNIVRGNDNVLIIKANSTGTLGDVGFPKIKEIYLSGSGKIEIIAKDFVTSSVNIYAKGGGVSPTPPSPESSELINIDALYDYTSIDIANNAWHNVLAPDDESYDFVLSGNVTVDADEVIFDGTAFGVREHETQIGFPTFYIVAYADTDYFTDNNRNEKVILIIDTSSTVIFSTNYSITCTKTSESDVYKYTGDSSITDLPSSYVDFGVNQNKIFNVMCLHSIYRKDDGSGYIRAHLNGALPGIGKSDFLWGGNFANPYNNNNIYVIHGNQTHGTTSISASTVPVHIKALAFSSSNNMSDVRKNSFIMLDKYVISKKVM